MPLGYCTECVCLKPIIKLGLKLGSRQCEWAPVEHDRPDAHVECGGTITWDEDVDVEARSITTMAICEKCGPVDCDAVVHGHGRCPGSRKPIR